MMKLVRDKIPELVEKSGSKNNYHFEELSSDEDFLFFLNEKLVEEVSELNGVSSANNLKRNEQLIGELVDIYEVFKAICKLYKINLEEVEKLCKNKNETSGGFDKKILMRTLNKREKK